MQQQSKFMEELKNDKVNLLKDKESHSKRIQELVALKNKHEAKIDVFSQRARIHEDNFKLCKEKYELLKKEHENQRKTNEIKDVKSSEVAEANKAQKIEIGTLQAELDNKEKSRKELQQQVQLMRTEV